MKSAQRKLACLLILALVLVGCATTKPDGSVVQPTNERILFSSLDGAVRAAIIAKAAVETLHDAKVISPAQLAKFNAVKERFKVAIQTAKDAAQKWSDMKPSPGKESAYAEAERLLAASLEVLKDVETLVTAFKKK
jgi:hypothetical protein